MDKPIIYKKLQLGITVVLLFAVRCSDSTVFTIENAGEPFSISFHYDAGHCSSSLILLENNANDTIRMLHKVFAPDEVGLVVRSNDMYHEKSVDNIWHYYPYKATKGSLKLKKTIRYW